MSRTRKALGTLIVLGLTGAVAGWATFSAFSSTTGSDGNRFAAGTVNLGDNSLGSFMYQVDTAEPGTTVTKCTKVTYTGSLDADVKLYASAVAAVGQYINLTVTPGTATSPTFPSCTGFTADGAALYTGTLKSFADTYTSYATGLADYPGSGTKWVADDAVVYQFTLTMQDDNGANGGATALTTGDHSFTWQARNQ
jgi:hypothetical protein